MRASHALCRADRIALDQAVDDLDPMGERDAVRERSAKMRKFDVGGNLIDKPTEIK
jgi:hypothetical protein